MLDNNLIDEVGEYLGFAMWNKRDKTKEYDFPGSREGNCLPGDEFAEGNIIIYNNIPLLVYKRLISLLPKPKLISTPVVISLSKILPRPISADWLNFGACPFIKFL